MTRCLAAWAGAIVVIAWAVLTAIAHFRRERPVPATRYLDDVQPPDPRTLYLSDNLTSADGGPVSLRWRN